MVMIDVGPKFVRVADPASGTVRGIARGEFEQKWTGYAALFDYTTAFDQAPEAASAASWMGPIFAKYKVVLIQAVLLAGVATAPQLLFPGFTPVVVDPVIFEQNMSLLKVDTLGIVLPALFF